MLAAPQAGVDVVVCQETCVLPPPGRTFSLLYLARQTIGSELTDVVGGCHLRDEGGDSSSTQ